jgi:NADH-quinone oxidoreductase subunit J
MDASFIAIAIIIAVSALAAVSMRNLVHCALALTVTFAGLAAAYLKLGAQFVGFAQILVYIGAVAILIVFAILLTRGNETGQPRERLGGAGWIGVLIALAALGVMGAAVLQTKGLPMSDPGAPKVSVADIGSKLMREFVVPLEVLGLLLTAAMIGAAIIALTEKKPEGATPIKTTTPLSAPGELAETAPADKA